MSVYSQGAAVRHAERRRYRSRSWRLDGVSAMLAKHEPGRLRAEFAWPGYPAVVRLLTVMDGDVMVCDPEKGETRALRARDAALLLPRRPVTCTATRTAQVLVCDVSTDLVTLAGITQRAPFLIGRQDAAVPSASAAFLVELLAHDLDLLPVEQRVHLRSMAVGAIVAAIDAVGVEGSWEWTTAAQSRSMVRRYIAAQCIDPELSSDAIAETLRISQRTLQRWFTGQAKTVAEEITEARVRHAVSRLRDPRSEGTSLSEVAALSGFTSGTAMRRAVKRTIGVCPSDFRSKSGAGRRSKP